VIVNVIVELPDSITTVSVSGGPPITEKNRVSL